MGEATICDEVLICFLHLAYFAYFWHCQWQRSIHYSTGCLSMSFGVLKHGLTGLSSLVGWLLMWWWPGHFEWYSITFHTSSNSSFSLFICSAMRDHYRTYYRYPSPWHQKGHIKYLNCFRNSFEKLFLWFYAQRRIVLATKKLGRF